MSVFNSSLSSSRIDYFSTFIFFYDRPYLENLHYVTARSNFHYCVLIGLLNLLFIRLDAQESDQTATGFYQLKDYFDRSYGADYNLLNGKKYYRLYFNTIGHPFFNQDQFRKGSLLINGVRYENVLIQYDIYNQQVILQQNDQKGYTEQLILTKEYIDEFTLDGKLFRRMSFPETGTQFFQIVNTEEVSCFLFWGKTMSIEGSSLTTRFTSQSAEIYLLVSNRLNLIRNTSSLIEIFGKEYSREIKRFKRRYRVSFRKVSDEGLRQLINYCVSLTYDN